MTPEDLELRRQVGLVLRVPIVGFLGILWIGLIWWWLAPLAVTVIVGVVTLQLVAYPFLYVMKYISLALQN
jgi:hypothetical protein